MISLGVIFLAALAFDALGRRTPLPRVTMLILFGFVAGPSGLDFFPDLTQAWFPVVADMALVMVGFLLGGRLTLRELRERGGTVIRISLAVVVVTFVLVGLGLAALGVPLAIVLLLAAIAAATDPAATVDVVHEARVDTPFSNTLLDIVAVDDAWGLIIFSVALAFSQLVVGDGAAEVLLHGAWELGGALVLGIAIGVPMAAVVGRVEPGEPSLYEALGAVFLCGGVAMLANVSFLLAAMIMGAVVENRARHHNRPFHAIEGIEWPFMTVFFVLAGASLELEVLSHAGVLLGAYVVLRILGRLAGGWIGGSFSQQDHFARRWIGLALLPQAGVALGMALVAAQRFPEIGEGILPVVVAATAIFEVLGPVATRAALRGSTRG
jgi:Kef-type K+ transport system membrane component KefB